MILHVQELGSISHNVNKGYGALVFVAYCLLGINYSAVLLRERVSECSNRIRALNKL